MIHFTSSLPRATEPLSNYFQQPYFYWPQCCDPDTVTRIQQVGEALETSDASVGDAENSGLHEDMRVSKVSWIFQQENTQFIYDTMIDRVDRINYYHYGMDLKAMDILQYTKYPEGGHYTFHNDVFHHQGMMRKLSLVLALTPASDYDGGEFAFFDRELQYKLKKGSAITFPSNYMFPHEIMPVTSGTRYSIITWFI